jgi:hypothetical protein
VLQDGDLVKEVKKANDKNEGVWHYDLRSLESLHRYMDDLIDVGNTLGQKLMHKLKGGTNKAHFEGMQVRTSPPA